MTQRLHSRGRGRSLPVGYQFGDAGKPKLSRSFSHDFSDSHRVGETIRIKLPRWRAPHLNAAEQLARRQFITDCDTGDER